AVRAGARARRRRDRLRRRFLPGGPRPAREGAVGPSDPARRRPPARPSPLARRPREGRRADLAKIAGACRSRGVHTGGRRIRGVWGEGRDRRGALRGPLPRPARRRQEVTMVKRSRLFPVLLSVLLGLALQAAPAQAAKSKSGKVNLNT